MKQNIQPTQKISGESFMTHIPKDVVLLESDFVRLDKSIIWKCSDLFWKHYALWENTYDEDFESSLPSGISESHKKEFIHGCVDRFLQVIEKLRMSNQLPHILYVYEQGPGTGVFAREFLDILKKRDKILYEKIVYILTDTSNEILKQCKKVLQLHKKHIEIFQQDIFEHMKMYDGKILYARHSNVWDGWPCRNIQVRKSGLGEVYVRAITESKFEKLIEDIVAYGLEKGLLKNTTQWKEFFRSIKLQTRTIACNKIDIEDKSYLSYLSTNVDVHTGTNTLLSDLILKNLSFLSRIIDWDKNGYAEIVDIISTHPRKITPKKFDGSIAYIVDGNIVTTWANENNKEVNFTPIRKLNTMVTITKKNTKSRLFSLLHNASYEIFPTEKIVQEDLVLPENTHLAVTCTSKKGVDYTINAARVLQEKGFDAYPHIIARQITDIKNLIEIQKNLIENNIQEIFVAGGDIEKPAGIFESAIDILHAFKEIGIPFEKIAITGYPEGHPKISSKKLLDALHEKQDFIMQSRLDGRIISQLCFDPDRIVQWAIELKEKGINVPIVVGIAGPSNILHLAQFAIKCGVGQSVKFLTSKKALGRNITTHLALTYQPENIMKNILSHPLIGQTNIVGFHFYTFNNMQGLVAWQEKLQEKMEVIKT